MKRQKESCTEQPVIHIDYNTERDRYYVWLDDENGDIQCFFAFVNAPTLRFTKNLENEKYVLDSKLYLS